MAKYKTEKQVIELMKDGWRLEAKTNYKKWIMSYWLHKKGEIVELSVTKKTRDLLVEKGMLDENDELPRNTTL